MNAHILVVDDEPDISALVAYHLARESYRVRTVGNGGEALRQDRVEGLRLGADDYMAMPFSPQELVLRVGPVLRRVRQSRPERARAPSSG
jgi:two-component system, OmpR family, phosphate regulon response regulator PhoB